MTLRRAQVDRAQRPGEHVIFVCQLLDADCLGHPHQLVRNVPSLLVRHAVSTVMIPGAPLAQHGTLCCHVTCLPNGHLHPSQPPLRPLWRVHYKLLFPDDIPPDPQQRIGLGAEHDAFLLKALDFIVEPRHVGLDVVPRVLARPDADRALVHRLLAAIDALLPLGDDDQHHLRLRGPPCDPPRVQRDLDMKVVLPPVPVGHDAHSPRRHLRHSALASFDNLHDARNLHLDCGPGRDEPAIRRRIDAQVLGRQRLKLRPGLANRLQRRQHTPSAHPLNCGPDRAERCCRQPRQRYLGSKYTHVEFVLALLAHLTLILADYLLFQLPPRLD